MTKIKTPAELQAEAVEYLRKLLATHTTEVWATDEDAGDRCSNNGCHRIGHVIVSWTGETTNYCLVHASNCATSRRGISTIDVARPILIPDELAASGELLELMRNFMYFVADHKSSTVTAFMAQRATALGNRCDEALKERTR